MLAATRKSYHVQSPCYSLPTRLLLLAALALPLLAQQPSYDLHETRDIQVPMRDGVKLALNLSRPARNGTPVPGKFPVILSRTPYDKNVPNPIIPFFVSHGYIVIQQDVRGRFASQGRWVPILDDGPDGFDTASWIGANPGPTAPSEPSAPPTAGPPNTPSPSPTRPISPP